jgi:hypothetical protein
VRCAPEGAVLSLVNGAFSERYAQIARACGRDTDVYEVPLGRTLDLDEVGRRLAAKRYAAVTVVHSETSTGVLNDLAAIAEAVRRAEAACGEEILLLVDGVTSVGGMLVEAEAWGIDFLLTGSQKAFALPPGLAFGTASARMTARAKVVLPAPRPPESVTRSPGCSSLAMNSPRRSVKVMSGSISFHSETGSPGPDDLGTASRSRITRTVFYSAASRRGAPSMGKVQITVVPAPGSDTRSTRPPCSSTKERTIDRPRPTPR